MQGMKPIVVKLSGYTTNKGLNVNLLRPGMGVNVTCRERERLRHAKKQQTTDSNEREMKDVWDGQRDAPITQKGQAQRHPQLNANIIKDAKKKIKESAMSCQKNTVTVIKQQPCEAYININAVIYNLNAPSANCVLIISHKELRNLALTLSRPLGPIGAQIKCCNVVLRCILPSG